MLSLLRGTKTPRLVESEDAEVVAQRELLRASEEAVELATSTSALLTQTAAQLMFALRLLSFC